MSERIAFERMIRKCARKYFLENIDDLLKGNIVIEDNGYMIKIYKKDKGPRNCDLGIVY